jgi:release factor glutamine methyltransferase
MHDPKIALYADNNGLAAYETIAQNARNWINSHGKIYIEIGIDQGTPIKQIFSKHNWTFIESKTDLGGIERVLIFRYKK